MARNRMTGAVHRTLSLLAALALIVSVSMLGTVARAATHSRVTPTADGKYILLEETYPDSTAGPIPVFANQQRILLQYALINPTSCVGAPGAWTVNSMPVHGQISTGTLSKMANGYCPGVYFTFAYIAYTWTAPASDGVTDSFSATWSQADQSQPWTFGMSLIDGNIASIGKTLGNCTCKGGGTPPPPGSQSAADPINVASGNVFSQVTDYTTVGQNPLAFTRYYNALSETIQFIALSDTTQLQRGAAATEFTGAVSLGGHWRSNYDRYLAPQDSMTVAAERPDGRTITFTNAGGGWVTDSDVGITLTQSGSSWTLTDIDDTVEVYAPDSSGAPRLASITSRGGYLQTLGYNQAGQLAAVTDGYGRALTFGYSGALLVSVTTPDATVLKYSYGISGIAGTTPDLLTGVTFPTTPATSLAYTYYGIPFPFLLTGVTDENGNPAAQWTYDGAGRAITSQRAGGADLTSIVYNDTDGSRTVTNALGQQEVDKFTTLQGVPKITEIDRLATSTTAAATRLFTYDSNGYLASSTDRDGNLTTYVNDARGLPLTTTEAAGTAQARMTVITWKDNLHVPASIATPGLTTSFAYSQGNPVSRIDAAAGLKRTWNYVWQNAQLVSVSGPRTDVAQTTTFGYGRFGRLSSIANALGQTTSITTGMPGGLPTTIVDPNGVITTLVYDARFRLTSSSVRTAAGRRTTTFAYDGVGNLVSATLPDGSFIANTYDAANRLTRSSDALSEAVNYSLDALGDRTGTAVANGQGTTVWRDTEAYDALGRVILDTRGAGQQTATAYDGNGNPLSTKDPLGRVTVRAFDALNRVASVTDPAKGVTSLSYDAHDRITGVSAPNGAKTSYVYDGFGRKTKQVSPDTLTTRYSYDLDDNLVQSTDGSAVVTNGSYDALDRISAASYPADPAENVVYSYDETGHGFGIGRLTSLTDAAGSLSRSYDERGNELAETRVSGSVSLRTAYGYDAASRIASIAYPSRTSVTYGRNAAGLVQTVTTTIGASVKTHAVASGIGNEPFGPVTGFAYGNGLTEARSYDADYRLTGLSVPGFQSLSYGYDAADNILAITDGIASANSQSLGYDALDRLTAAKGAYGSYGWSYDAAGNRLTQTVQGVSMPTTYAYSANSNRLTGITGASQSTQISYTGAGAISAMDPSTGVPTTFAYDQAERLSTVTQGQKQIGLYSYDAFGRRFSKTLADTSQSLFVYDRAGHLLEETDGTGKAKTDTIYLDDRPIADVTPAAGALYFLHTDQLGTPQLATTTLQAIAWQAAYDPFGINSGAKGLLTQNLRFPGQYADKETGLYQNGFRDYNPAWGRYLESDPIGLGGGVNTFGYVGANPGRDADPSGLVRCTSGGLFCFPEPGDDFTKPSTPTDEFITNALTLLITIPVGGPEIKAAQLCEKLAAAEEAGGIANSLGLARQLTSEEQVGQLLAGKGEAILGAGTDQTLIDAERLAEEYGGSPADWAKVRSDSSSLNNVQTPAGSNFETHAYQNMNTGQVVEIKTKMLGH